jgi:general secretion pathway protein D
MVSRTSKRLLCLLLLSVSFSWIHTSHAAPATKATDSIVATPVKGKKPDEMVGPIVMGNMPLLQVLDLLRDFSGRVVIPGGGIPATKVNFNSGGKLKRTEAIFAVENILAMNGVTLRLLDNGFVRATPIANVHRGAAPMLESIPEGAESQQIFTKVFKLEYMDSSTAFHRVRGVVTPGASATIENQPEINSLLITDSLNNLKRIEEILDLLDQPPEVRLELYTFPIVNSSPWHIRGLYYVIYGTSLNQRLRGSLVYADSRANKLIVVTHPSNFEFFDNLVKELDQEVAPFTTTEIIQIKQGNFWSIWSILHGIVRHQQSQFARRGLTSPEERDQSTESTGRLTSAGELSTMAEGEAPPPEQQAVTSLETPLPGADPNAVMSENASPELQFSPYIGLYADPSNLAYVVYGTQSDIERIRSLVEQLDVKSAPYVINKVFEIEHARASDIRNVIEYTIAVQRRAFGRAGIQSGQERSQSESLPNAAQTQEASEQGFEYSAFVSTYPDNRNNTILVQGTQQDLAQIEDLIEKLDVESAPLTTNEVIYLKHAQAQTLARVVQNIINYQRWMFSRQRTISQSGENNADPTVAPEIGFEFSDYAVVNADRRTNALFVYGTRNDIERVKSIILETDIPVEPMTTTEVFPLTHTDANQTASLINRVVFGQSRALRQVRSEAREIPNPAAANEGAPNPGGVVEGDEALQFSPFITITPDRRSNSLIVYGTDSDIRQVSALIAQVDIEVAPLTTSKVFLLENTQARTLHRVLQSVVSGQERALRRVRSSIREIRNTRPGEEAELIEADTALETLQFSPYVTITPNDRNNSIIIYGTESDIAQLEKLIVVSDVQIAPKTRSRTFFIRHADANDISRTISTLIRQQQVVRQREQTLTRVFRRGEQGGLTDGMEETESEGSTLNDDLIQETVSTDFSDLYSYDEDLQFSPYVSIVADDRSNSVLAYGTSFDLEQVSSLIEQIDKVLPQVRIEVVIAEVILRGDQISGLETFGISYNVTNPNQTTIGANSPTLGSGTSGPAFNTNFSLNDFSLDAVFGIAKSDSNVKVLSAPAITTTHNRMASINVGESRPVITSSASNLNTNDLVTRSTIEFRDIGITLRVRPLVSENGFIQLDLEQVVETVIDTQTIDGNVQPIIGTRRASSFVSVRDEEVIVMGGLQAVDSSESDGEVFVLGKVPIFGSLFRPRSSTSTVRELIIFIRPKIVESMAESELMTEQQLETSTVGQEVDHYFEEGQFKEQKVLRDKIDAADASPLEPEEKRKRPKSPKATPAAEDGGELIPAVRNADTEAAAE